jgi:hypothetical protein
MSSDAATCIIYVCLSCCWHLLAKFEIRVSNDSSAQCNPLINIFVMWARVRDEDQPEEVSWSLVHVGGKLYVQIVTTAADK